MYVQELEPVADSLGLSALVATLPLVIALVLLGGVRMKAHRAGLIGLFPILWIVVNALWVYRMTVRTRHFDVLRRSFGRLSDDPASTRCARPWWRSSPTPRRSPSERWAHRSSHSPKSPACHWIPSPP